jgi:hypothetical protein
MRSEARSLSGANGDRNTYNQLDQRRNWRAAGWMRLTSFVPEKSPFRTLKDWSTQRPATIALVVAMAGMMFPAICLISKRDFVSIPKMMDRKLALAETKSRVSSYPRHPYQK